MDSTDRIELVDRMKYLVNELYRLETCYPAKRHVPCQLPPTPPAPPSQLPCFMMKCKLPKCRSNPDLEPLITWTPVMEIRKTTNPKVCKNPPDDPTVRYVYVEPPKKPTACTSMDPCLGHCPILRESGSLAPSRHRSPLRDCDMPTSSPAYNQDGTVELCCPTFGPPVDSSGRPYLCQVTLDGRTICRPTDDLSGSAQPIGCDRKQPQSRFPKCDEKKIMTRGKVLNTRKNTCEPPTKRPASSQCKRPVYPPRHNCLDSQCRCTCATKDSSVTC